jgi:hypothetical protein
MTPKELEEKLKALKAAGVDPGKWGNVEAHSAKVPQVNEIAEGLKKLRDMLEGVAEADRKKILELKLQATRMARGGGS